MGRRWSILSATALGLLVAGVIQAVPALPGDGFAHSQGVDVVGPARVIPNPAAYESGPSLPVIPAPQRAVYPDGRIPLERLVLPAGQAGAGVLPGGRQAIEVLQELLEQETGGRLQPAGAPVSSVPAAPLRLGTREDAELRRQASSLGLDTERPEGYSLHVGDDGAFVMGTDPQGLLYGIFTLVQLLVATDQGPALRYADIVDWPAFPIRMAMVYLDGYSPEVNDRLIPILARLKFNRVLVMSNYVQWESTQDIWHPQGASKAEARRIAQLIREHGMEPIPLIELLGHVQWLFYGGRNQDLRQDPESPEPWAYDTLNPRTYEVVLPILDEAIEVFEPEYVHIGHDEVRNVGRFPATEEGRRIGFNRLFLDDTLRLYYHLRSRGVGTMMWQDVAFSGATKEIVADLPKDIVFTSWHYFASDDYPMLREIQRAGFQVIGASWYKPGNPEAMAQVASAVGAWGMLQTRWTGYFGNRTVVDGSTDQAVGYVRGAASFWNASAPVDEGVAAQVLASLWRGEPWQQVSGRLVDLRPYVTRSLVDPDGSGWVGKGPDYDLAAMVRQIRDGELQAGPYRFAVEGAVMTRTNRAVTRRLPERVTVPLQGRAAGVAVLHTTGWPAPGSGQMVGRYVLEYQDGTQAEFPLRYGREIAAWTEPQFTSMIRFPAWRGISGAGLEIGLDVLEIANPHPEKELAAFTIVSDVRWGGPVVLGVTLLDTLPQRRPLLDPRRSHE